MSASTNDERTWVSIDTVAEVLCEHRERIVKAILGNNPPAHIVVESGGTWFVNRVPFILWFNGLDKKPRLDPGTLKEDKTWVRTSTIAKDIDIRPKQISELINAGKIPEGCYRRLGGMWFIHRENFMRWFVDRKLPAEARRRGGNRRA